MSHCKILYQQVLQTHSSTDKVRNPISRRPILPFKETFQTVFSPCDKEMRVSHLPCRKPSSLPVLVYQGNSCYKDSLLMALFLRSHHYVDKFFLDRDPATIPFAFPFPCGKTRDEQIQNVREIQFALRKLAFYLRFYSLEKRPFLTHVDDYLNPVLHKYCPSRMALRFMRGEQNDPEEFAQFLFQLFPIEARYRGKLQRKMSYYTADRKQRQGRPSIVYEEVDCIFNLSSQILFQFQEGPFFDIDQHMKSMTEMTTLERGRFTIKQDVLRFVKYPKLFFIKVDRADAIHGFLPLPVLPSLWIVSAKLHLFAIICKMDREIDSGHYVSFLRCEDLWYFYDDMNPNQKLVQVGKYSKLLRNPVYTSIVLTQSTFLMYNQETAFASTIDLQEIQRLRSWLQRRSLRI